MRFIPLAAIAFEYKGEVDPVRLDVLTRRLRKDYLGEWMEMGYAPCVNVLGAEPMRLLETLIERRSVDQAAEFMLEVACDCCKPWRDCPEACRVVHDALTDPEVGTVHLFRWIPKPRLAESYVPPYAN